jgi:hypothetical protein
MLFPAKEKVMVRSQTSLRRLVEKWLAPTLAKPVRITRFSRIANQRRYICVEAVRPTDMLVIFFFRHDDGAWRVFPPVKYQPAMKAY